MTDYRADPAILSLGEAFYDAVEPAEFPEHSLRYRDDVAAGEIGLAPLNDAEWIDHFARFQPLPDNLTQPLALRYHGHQFRHYNPDIGDGRGFLFAQVRDVRDRLLDLGTKGSGRTPYSRQGDGRLTLLGGIREVLATRYLQHLGVKTSRSLSLVETGEALHRGDEPSPTRSAVLVRLSHSHIRFGTFQRLFFHGLEAEMDALVGYCRTHFHPDARNAAEMFTAVTLASADTVASWMAAGFVHGVMNTDNMNITGESFDYGPYRFLETLRPGKTAAYFDHAGLYAFARQPEAMAWNLAQLAQALSLITEDAPLMDALGGFADIYRDRLSHHVLHRLGIAPRDPSVDARFVAQTFDMLEATQYDWPRFWSDMAGGAGRADIKAYGGPAFEDWFKAYRTYEAIHAVARGPASLAYAEIGNLWEPIATQDDWSHFHDKLATFERDS